MASVMAGRKRKSGRRRRGRLIVDRMSPRVIAALMPHRRGLDEDKQLDQDASYELGRMKLRGQISEEQKLAGLDWARTYGGYLATIDGPKSPGARGFGADVTDVEALIRQKLYRDALKALWEAGNVYIRAVNLVALQDQECPEYLLKYLRMGLSALVLHYGVRLTVPKKSDSAEMQTRGLRLIKGGKV
jgi:hypothetical protein